MLPIELINNLKTFIPEYRDHGLIYTSSLRVAFDVAGLHLTNKEMMEVENSFAGERNSLDLIEFEKLLFSFNQEAMFPQTSSYNNLYTDSTDLKAYSGNEDFETKHTVSSAEERGYSDWINRLLADDIDLIIDHLPLKTTNDDIYKKCKDGLLLCKLINKAVPKTIDERVINKGESLKSLFKKQENLVLAINSAASIGCCVVNIGPGDISDGTKHIILGLLWQVIRSGLLGQINLVYNPNLAALMLPGESLENLKNLSPEELLIRWLNYQLIKSGSAKQVRNFKDDIMTSEAYIYLIDQIAPDEKRPLLTAPEDILKVTNLVSRAELVLKNAAVLNSRVFVSAEDIANVNVRGKNRDKLNLAFVANLFNTYPALEEPNKIEIVINETLEEKTYRNWINSLGAVHQINSFYYDVSDGLILLHVLDKMNEGCVNWKRVIKRFDPKKRLFQEQENCNEVIEASKKCGLQVQQVSGENIRRKDRVYILGLCFQMMRYQSVRVLEKLSGNYRKIDDQDIIMWINDCLKKAGKKSRIDGFKDNSISSSIPILDVIDAIKPGSVKYQLVTGNKLDDANYALSLARKIGAYVFILPEHVVNVHSKMMMNLFASLMAAGLGNH